MLLSQLLRRLLLLLQPLLLHFLKARLLLSPVLLLVPALGLPLPGWLFAQALQRRAA